MKTKNNSYMTMIYENCHLIFYLSKNARQIFKKNIENSPFLSLYKNKKTENPRTNDIFLDIKDKDIVPLIVSFFEIFRNSTSRYIKISKNKNVFTLKGFLPEFVFENFKLRTEKIATEEINEILKAYEMKSFMDMMDDSKAKMYFGLRRIFSFDKSLIFEKGKPFQISIPKEDVVPFLVALGILTRKCLI